MVFNPRQWFFLIRGNENEFSYSREHIINPWERITSRKNGLHYSLFRYTYGFFMKYFFAFVNSYFIFEITRECLQIWGPQFNFVFPRLSPQDYAHHCLACITTCSPVVNLILHYYNEFYSYNSGVKNVKLMSFFFTPGYKFHNLSKW